MIIFKNKTGQLGNNLFEFATFLAISKEHNHWLINLSFSQNSKYFEGTKRSFNLKNKILVSTFKLHRLVLIYFVYLFQVFKAKLIKANHEMYDLNKEDWNHKLIIKDGGWFVDFKNFYKHQDYIREFFKPVPKHWNNVLNFIENAKSENEILVGIHIRRGDYKYFQDGKFYFSDSEYFNKISQIQELFKDKKLKFILASNENLDLINYPFDNILLAPNHFIEDMYVLSQCDYIFGPPSTYSMWASFYGKKPLLKFRTQDQQLKLEDFQLDYGY